MFRSLVLAIAMLLGLPASADTRPTLSQAARQCLAAAGVMHDRKDGRLLTIEPRMALPACRAAQAEAAQAVPIVRFAAGQGMMTSTYTQEVQAGLALIESAAAEGLPQAQYRLGVLYEQGLFKQRDRCSEFNECRARDRRHAEEALKYYALAAPKYGHAASALGYAYYYGANGARRDLGKALENLTRAADAGVPAAMRLLGPMYMSGHGAPMDKVRGLELVGLAAQMGDRQAQEMIGDFSLRGDGLRPNRNLAIAWYQKAKSSGSMIAADKLRQLGVVEWTAGQVLLALTVTGIVLMTLTPDGPEGRARAEKVLRGSDCEYPWMVFDAYSCINLNSGVIVAR